MSESNETESGSGGPNRETLGRFYTQDEVDALFNRVVNVNVNSGPPPVTVDVYPGLGAMNAVHAILTFLFPLTFFWWGIVWAIHAHVARKRWNEAQELKREAERQQREDQS